MDKTINVRIILIYFTCHSGTHAFKTSKRYAWENFKKPSKFSEALINLELSHSIRTVSSRGNHLFQAKIKAL